jgi:hypothetical protein
MKRLGRFRPSSPRRKRYQVRDFSLTQDEQIAKILVWRSLIEDNPDNYMIHPEEQLRDLEASLKRFGQVEPAVVKRCGDHFMLVAHEGVTTAARRLYTLDPLVYKHLNHYLIAVVPDHWTDADVQGYMVVSNQSSRLRVADDGKLYMLLSEQRESHFDLHSVGMSDKSYMTLQDLLQEDAHWTSHLIEATDTPKEPQKESDNPRQEHREPRQEELFSAPTPATNAQFRQLVLVMSTEAYDTLTMCFNVLREKYGLGSHADIVMHLLDSYLEHNPEMVVGGLV